MELGISTRKCMFGEKSQELQEGCRQYARFCNRLVMESFAKQNVPQMLHYLRRGEQLSFSGACSMELMEAYQTLAEIYKEKDTRLALHFLENALQKEVHFTSHKQKVDFIQIHLNICALLSRIGQHSKALNHAQMALACLENNFRPPKCNVATEVRRIQPRRAFKSDRVSLPINIKTTPPQPNNRSSMMFEHPSSIDENSICEDVRSREPRTCQRDDATPPDDQPTNVNALFGIAYFNIGTQLEFLKDFSSSLESYRRGEAAFRVLGQDHPVLDALQTSRLQLERVFVNT